MKKTLVRTLSALLALMMLLLGVHADGGDVIYSGDAGEFIFSPGSEYSPTDLFSEMKDVMPGDSIQETLKIRNDASNKVKIKIYMRSLGAQEGSEEFLSQLHLTVSKNEESEMAYMFDASAEKATLADEWIYIGTLYSGGETEMSITLDVPTSLDNRFKNAVGYLEWEFMVEEHEVEPDDPKPPYTGDEEMLALWIGVFVLSLALIVVLLVMYRKKDKEQQQS